MTDVASPGCMPTSLGTVWTGEVNWPGHFSPTAPALSDDDVERIAKRVVGLLREAQP